MKTVIIDGNAMAYRSVFSAVKLFPEDNEEFYFWRHLMTDTIFQILRKFSPDRMVVVFDDKNSWRKNIYSEYKQHRKTDRQKSVVDFDKFFPVFKSFTEDLKAALSNMHIISIPGCEGDDIISQLIKHKFSEDEVVIVSMDSDMHQLLNENVKQYDMIKQDFHNCMNPKLELDIKILSGERGDNIKPIRAKIGPVTAEKILNEGLDKFLTENPDLKPNWELNRTLIDFNFIPDYITRTIINTYEDYQLSAINSMTMLKFLSHNRLNRIMDEMSNNDKHLDKLNGNLQSIDEVPQGGI